MKFKKNITKSVGKYTATLFVDGKRVYKISNIETLEDARLILDVYIDKCYNEPDLTKVFRIGKVKSIGYARLI